MDAAIRHSDHGRMRGNDAKAAAEKRILPACDVFLPAKANALRPLGCRRGSNAIYRLAPDCVLLPARSKPVVFLQRDESSHASDESQTRSPSHLSPSLAPGAPAR